MLPPSSDHQHQLPLQGLAFAIKEIRFGSAAAFATAATGVGTTVMDEMTYNMNRENAHYALPLTPMLPVASPSASAVTVAASLADFALDTDTGDSFSVPPAYCVIFYLRPSHGPVSTESVLPMAQMFDTVGWFARDMATLSLVTDVLLPPVPANTIDAELQQPSRVLISGDCFKILGSMEDCTYEILNASAAKVFGILRM
ncbi:amidase 1-like [Hordeum vulgare subsp. vulgare]|uniref:amidase 1-like n=1 Tax=Hordeum vulgare subsp. vulgare TaxID=112509 RepID=UPI001D1A3415|nr:amidase 1-like [Hordeum vulgare subsp. vulgare]